MPPFLVYEGKVAVAMLVFYLFYRYLLKKETFHRFNRIVLVGTAVLSFLSPSSSRKTPDGHTKKTAYRGLFLMKSYDAMTRCWPKWETLVGRTPPRRS